MSSVVIASNTPRATQGQPKPPSTSFRVEVACEPTELSLACDNCTPGDSLSQGCFLALNDSCCESRDCFH